MSDDRIILAENIAPTALEAFAQAGIRDVRRLSHAIGPDEAGALSGAEVLGIRSRTLVTPALLDAFPDLVAIGCFSVGTNQVDLAAARARGCPCSTRRSRTPAAWRN